MPQSTASAAAVEGQFTADLRGVHYDFIKERIPPWFMQAGAHRQRELGNYALQLPAWLGRASIAQKDRLAQSHTRLRNSQNRVEATLGSIQDIYAFAEQPLKEAIKAKFNLDLDVRSVFFARKYGRQRRDDVFGAFVFEQTSDSPLNVVYRGMSLLQAALANFEPAEAEPAPCGDCQIITGWSDYDGEIIADFAAVNAQAVPIAPHAFAGLCRELDLGAQYQQHIKSLLQPEDWSKREIFEREVEDHHRQQLSLSCEIARLQGAASLSANTLRVLDQVLADQNVIFTAGRPVTYTGLSVFGIELTGPLLIGPDREGSARVERLVVYLPNDPEQPLKVYASSGEFMADLRARLHGAAFRDFFSRFVPVRQQGVFLTKFNELYKPSDLGSGADYPLPASSAKLPLAQLPITENLWQHCRQAQFNKIFADARAVAVPTGDEDREARIKRLESYLDAVVNVFNLAAFVVPGLGPLMLLVGSAQMCDELFEGVQAYEQGELTQLWAHLSSVALNVAFVGAGSVVLPAIHISSVVERLKPVTLDDGRQKLWRAELAPYRASITLAAGARPDEQGLYSVNGQQYINLDDRYYRVERDPATDTYRIRHPSRAEAYSPHLMHNDQGTWRHELDQPLTWKGPTLMRRIGPLVDGLSDAELEQVRHVSGVDEAALRRMHVEGESLPGILQDTLRRFRAYHDAMGVAEGIGAGALPDRLCSYAASLATELPGWPPGKAIEASGFNGASVKYGAADALPADTLSISREELMSGELPARIFAFLDEPQMDQLISRYTAREPQARINEVRTRLQALAEQSRVRLMRSVYLDPTPVTDPGVALVQRDFQRLPTQQVRELLAQASPAEQRTLAQGQRIPLRVAERARRLQREARLSSAYEGLYLEALANEDTEALVLHTLTRVPGWNDHLRLEVREGGMAGRLRASTGDESTVERKTLVRTAEGRYQAFDQRGQQLHGIDDFYASLQHALTDARRSGIGVPHVGQGEQLKALIVAHVLPREQLRPVLGLAPERQGFFRRPLRVSGTRHGYPLSGRGEGSWDRIIRERVRTLYPSMNEAQMQDYLQTHNAADDRWLKALEREFKQLDSVMNRWLAEGPRDRGSLKRRRKIYELIRSVWRKNAEWDLDTGGQYRGQRIVLQDSTLGEHLATLPPLPGNFDHVSSVHLSGCGLTDPSVAFLSVFRRLRILNLENNQLTRLPDVCADMPRMEGLDLSDNDIVLTPESALQIRDMHRLEWLALQGNPLSVPVDISRMPRLNWLYLSGCGLREWPPGLFASPRPRGFLLELTGNRLDTIPDVAPGSYRAGILARTAVTRDWVTAEVRDRLSLYVESVGMDPSRRFPPRGTQDSALWMRGLSQQQWLGKQETWNALEETPGSESFFDEIRKLSENLSKRSGEYSTDLTAKVWRMLEAMAADTGLRERLFEMSLAPTTCVDAAAQLFNAMGVEVMLYEALSLANADLMKLQLLELAKGKARLDELAHIANARIKDLLAQGRKFPDYDADGALVQHLDAAGRPVRSIDEVEIHMAYATQLTQRLDLPWQTRMYFNEPDVTPAMLEAAYQRVVAMEEGDLMRDRMLDQHFWKDYLEPLHHDEIATIRATGEALTDLNVAQQTLADNGRLSTERKAQLQHTVQTSADVLGRSPQKTLSNDEYYAQMGKLGEARKDLLRRATDRIMGRGSAVPPQTPAKVQNRK